MAALPEVDASTWREVAEAPVGVLVLGKTDCPACAEWTAELERALEAESEFEGRVRFGKIYLDKAGLIDFKRANPWLADVDALPWNQVFVAGERSRSFAGGGMSRLRNRLRPLLEGG